MKKNLKIPLLVVVCAAFILQVLTLSLIGITNKKILDSYKSTQYIWVVLYCLFLFGFLIAIFVLTLKKTKNSAYVSSILCISYGIISLFSFLTISWYYGIPNFALGIVLIIIGSIYIHKNKENYY
ncbi:hypothetical protein SLITO_v1c01130 [Spiroplasma litorale]|uniref:EamA domain-containing protein n=1 Tax=Spiroplasma litorale TaxID=216942 RepID=A0A0K1W0S9_9MOLU|nr:hypothetical protein [Spiroplasma litorale]AKX33781.1 hypothetical protein SLITO_v1c01130 [Spiroplasma litorale]